MIRRMLQPLGLVLGMVMGAAPAAPAMGPGGFGRGPVMPPAMGRPNFPGNHPPGWDWWRTYPWSPYNAYRNPYWYPPYNYNFPIYDVPPVVYPPAAPVQAPVVNNPVADDVPTPTGAVTPPPGSALIKVTLPDAFGKVLFNGQDPTSVGQLRYYSTPRIQPGGTVSYTISATFQQNGRTVTQTKQVTLSQGQTTTVNFQA